MPYIKVNVDKIKEYQQDVYNIRRKVNTISSSFSNISGRLDSDVKNSSGIRRKLQNIESSFGDHKTVLQRTNTFLGNTSLKYINAEKTIYAKDKASGDASFVDVSTVVKKIAEKWKLRSQDVEDVVLSGEHSIAEIVKYAAGNLSNGAVAAAFEKIGTNNSSRAEGAIRSAFQQQGSIASQGFRGVTIGTASASIKKTVTSNTSNKITDYITLQDVGKNTLKGIFKSVAYFTGKLNITKVGDYLRIKGNQTIRSIVDYPKGTRVKIGSDVYYDKGYAWWYKDSTASDRLKALKGSFSGFFKDTYGVYRKTTTGKVKLKWGNILQYGMIAVDTVNGIKQNYQNGASTSKIFADATTEVAKGLGSMAAVSAGTKIGAAIGSICPGFGTIVGGIVGGALSGLVYDFAVDGIQIGGKSIAGWVSTGLEKAGDWIGEQCNKVGDAVRSTAKTAVKAVKDLADKSVKKVQQAVRKVNETTKNIVNSVQKVGDAVVGKAKSAVSKAKKFFKKLF